MPLGWSWSNTRPSLWDGVPPPGRRRGGSQNGSGRLPGGGDRRLGASAGGVRGEPRRLELEQGGSGRGDDPALLVLHRHDVFFEQQRVPAVVRPDGQRARLV